MLQRVKSAYSQKPYRVLPASLYTRPTMPPYMVGMQGPYQNTRQSGVQFEYTLKQMAASPYSVNNEEYMKDIREKYGYNDENLYHTFGVIGGVVGAGMNTFVHSGLLGEKPIRTFRDFVFKSNIVDLQDIKQTSEVSRMMPSRTAKKLSAKGLLYNVDTASKTALKAEAISDAKKLKVATNNFKSALKASDKTADSVKTAATAYRTAKNTAAASAKVAGKSAGFVPAIDTAADVLSLGINVAGITQANDPFLKALYTIGAVADVVDVAGDFIPGIGTGAALIAGVVSLGVSALTGYLQGQTVGRSLTPSGSKVQQLFLENLYSGMIQRPITTAASVLSMWGVSSAARGLSRISGTNAFKGLLGSTGRFLSDNALGNQVRAGVSMLTLNAVSSLTTQIEDKIMPRDPSKMSFVSAISLYGDYQDNMYGATANKAVLQGLAEGKPDAMAKAFYRSYGMTDDMYVSANFDDIRQALGWDLSPIGNSIFSTLGELIIDPQNMKEIVYKHSANKLVDATVRVLEADFRNQKAIVGITNKETENPISKLFVEGGILHNASKEVIKNTLHKTAALLVSTGDLKKTVITLSQDRAKGFKTTFTKSIVGVPEQFEIIGKYILDAYTNKLNYKTTDEKRAQLQRTLDDYTRIKKASDDKTELSKEDEVLKVTALKTLAELSKMYGKESLDEVVEMVINDLAVKPDKFQLATIYNSHTDLRKHQEIIDTTSNLFNSIANPAPYVIKGGIFAFTKLGTKLYYNHASEEDKKRLIDTLNAHTTDTSKLITINDLEKIIAKSNFKKALYTKDTEEILNALPKESKEEIDALISEHAKRKQEIENTRNDIKNTNDKLFANQFKKSTYSYKFNNETIYISNDDNSPNSKNKVWDRYMDMKKNVDNGNIKKNTEEYKSFTQLQDALLDYLYHTDYYDDLSSVTKQMNYALDYVDTLTYTTVNETIKILAAINNITRAFNAEGYVNNKGKFVEKKGAYTYKPKDLSPLNSEQQLLVKYGIVPVVIWGGERYEGQWNHTIFNDENKDKKITVSFRYENDLDIEVCSIIHNVLRTSDAQYMLNGISNVSEFISKEQWVKSNKEQKHTIIIKMFDEMLLSPDDCDTLLNNSSVINMLRKSIDNTYSKNGGAYTTKTYETSNINDIKTIVMKKIMKSKEAENPIKIVLENFKEIENKITAIYEKWEHKENTRIAETIAHLLDRFDTRLNNNYVFTYLKAAFRKDYKDSNRKQGIFLSYGRERELVPTVTNKDKEKIIKSKGPYKESKVITGVTESPLTQHMAKHAKIGADKAKAIMNEKDKSVADTLSSEEAVELVMRKNKFKIENERVEDNRSGTDINDPDNQNEKETQLYRGIEETRVYNYNIKTKKISLKDNRQVRNKAKVYLFIKYVLEKQTTPFVGDFEFEGNLKRSCGVKIKNGKLSYISFFKLANNINKREYKKYLYDTMAEVVEFDALFKVRMIKYPKKIRTKKQKIEHLVNTYLQGREIKFTITPSKVSKYHLSKVFTKFLNEVVDQTAERIALNSPVYNKKDIKEMIALGKPVEGVTISYNKIYNDTLDMFNKYVSVTDTTKAYKYLDYIGNKLYTYETNVLFSTTQKRLRGDTGIVKKEFFGNSSTEMLLDDIIKFKDTDPNTTFNTETFNILNLMNDKLVVDFKNKKRFTIDKLDNIKVTKNTVVFIIDDEEYTMYDFLNSFKGINLNTIYRIVKTFAERSAETKDIDYITKLQAQVKLAYDATLNKYKGLINTNILDVDEAVFMEAQRGTASDEELKEDFKILNDSELYEAYANLQLRYGVDTRASRREMNEPELGALKNYENLPIYLNGNLKKTYTNSFYMYNNNKSILDKKGNVLVDIKDIPDVETMFLLNILFPHPNAPQYDDDTKKYLIHNIFFEDTKPLTNEKAYKKQKKQYEMRKKTLDNLKKGVNNKGEKIVLTDEYINMYERMTNEAKVLLDYLEAQQKNFVNQEFKDKEHLYKFVTNKANIKQTIEIMHNIVYPDESNLVTAYEILEDGTKKFYKVHYTRVENGVKVENVKNHCRGIIGENSRIGEQIIKKSDKTIVEDYKKIIREKAKADSAYKNIKIKYATNKNEANDIIVIMDIDGSIPKSTKEALNSKLRYDLNIPRNDNILFLTNKEIDDIEAMKAKGVYDVIYDFEVTKDDNGNINGYVNNVVNVAGIKKIISTYIKDLLHLPKDTGEIDEYVNRLKSFGRVYNKYVSQETHRGYIQNIPYNRTDKYAKFVEEAEVNNAYLKFVQAFNDDYESGVFPFDLEYLSDLFFQARYVKKRDDGTYFTLKEFENTANVQNKLIIKQLKDMGLYSSLEKALKILQANYGENENVYDIINFSKVLTEDFIDSISDIFNITKSIVNKADKNLKDTETIISSYKRKMNKGYEYYNTAQEIQDRKKILTEYTKGTLRQEDGKTDDVFSHKAEYSIKERLDKLRDFKRNISHKRDGGTEATALKTAAYESSEHHNRLNKKVHDDSKHKGHRLNWDFFVNSSWGVNVLDELAYINLYDKNENKFKLNASLDDWLTYVAEFALKNNTYKKIPAFANLDNTDENKESNIFRIKSVLLWVLGKQYDGNLSEHFVRKDQSALFIEAITKGMTEGNTGEANLTKIVGSIDKAEEARMSKRNYNYSTKYRESVYTGDLPAHTVMLKYIYVLLNSGSEIEKSEAAKIENKVFDALDHVERAYFTKDGKPVSTEAPKKPKQFKKLEEYLDTLKTKEDKALVHLFMKYFKKVNPKAYFHAVLSEDVYPKDLRERDDGSYDIYLNIDGVYVEAKVPDDYYQAMYDIYFRKKTEESNFEDTFDVYSKLGYDILDDSHEFKMFLNNYIMGVNADNTAILTELELNTYAFKNAHTIGDFIYKIRKTGAEDIYNAIAFVAFLNIAKEQYIRKENKSNKKIGWATVIEKYRNKTIYRALKDIKNIKMSGMFKYHSPYNYYDILKTESAPLMNALYNMHELNKRLRSVVVSPNQKVDTYVTLKNKNIRVVSTNTAELQRAYGADLFKIFWKPNNFYTPQAQYELEMRRSFGDVEIEYTIEANAKSLHESYTRNTTYNNIRVLFTRAMKRLTKEATNEKFVKASDIAVALTVLLRNSNIAEFYANEYKTYIETHVPVDFKTDAREEPREYTGVKKELLEFLKKQTNMVTIEEPMLDAILGYLLNFKYHEIDSKDPAFVSRLEKASKDAVDIQHEKYMQFINGVAYIFANCRNEDEIMDAMKIIDTDELSEEEKLTIKSYIALRNITDTTSVNMKKVYDTILEMFVNTADINADRITADQNLIKIEKEIKKLKAKAGRAKNNLDTYTKDYGTSYHKDVTSRKEKCIEEINKLQKEKKQLEEKIQKEKDEIANRRKYIIDMLLEQTNILTYWEEQYNKDLDENINNLRAERDDAIKEAVPEEIYDKWKNIIEERPAIKEAKEKETKEEKYERLREEKLVQVVKPKTQRAIDKGVTTIKNIAEYKDVSSETFSDAQTLYIVNVDKTRIVKNNLYIIDAEDRTDKQIKTITDEIKKKTAVTKFKRIIIDESLKNIKNPDVLNSIKQAKETTRTETFKISDRSVVKKDGVVYLRYDYFKNKIENIYNKYSKPIEEFKIKNEEKNTSEYEQKHKEEFVATYFKIIFNAKQKDIREDLKKRFKDINKRVQSKFNIDKIPNGEQHGFIDAVKESIKRSGTPLKDLTKWRAALNKDLNNDSNDTSSSLYKYKGYFKDNESEYDFLIETIINIITDSAGKELYADTILYDLKKLSAKYSAPIEVNNENALGKIKDHNTKKLESLHTKINNSLSKFFGTPKKYTDISLRTYELALRDIEKATTKTNKTHKETYAKYMVYKEAHDKIAKAGKALIGHQTTTIIKPFLNHIIHEYFKNDYGKKIDVLDMNYADVKSAINKYLKQGKDAIQKQFKEFIADKRINEKQISPKFPIVSKLIVLAKLDIKDLKAGTADSTVQYKFNIEDKYDKTTKILAVTDTAVNEQKYNDNSLNLKIQKDFIEYVQVLETLYDNEILDASNLLSSKDRPDHYKVLKNLTRVKQEQYKKLKKGGHATALVEKTAEQIKRAIQLCIYINSLNNVKVKTVKEIIGSIEEHVEGFKNLQATDPNNTTDFKAMVIDHTTDANSKKNRENIKKLDVNIKAINDKIRENEKLKKKHEAALKYSSGIENTEAEIRKIKTKIETQRRVKNHVDGLYNKDRRISNSNIGTYIKLYNVSEDTPEDDVLQQILETSKDMFDTAGNKDKKQALINTIKKHGGVNLHNPVVDVLVTNLNYRKQIENSDMAEDEKTKALAKYSTFDMETLVDVKGATAPYMLTMLLYADGKFKLTTIYLNNYIFFLDKNNKTLINFYKQQEQLLKQSNPEITTAEAAKKTDALIEKIKKIPNNLETIQLFLHVLNSSSEDYIAVHNGLSFDMPNYETFVKELSKRLLHNLYFRRIQERYDPAKIKSGYIKAHANEERSAFYNGVLEKMEKEFKELYDAYKKSITPDPITGKLGPAFDDKKLELLGKLNNAIVAAKVSGKIHEALVSNGIITNNELEQQILNNTDEVMNKIKDYVFKYITEKNSRDDILNELVQYIKDGVEQNVIDSDIDIDSMINVIKESTKASLNLFNKLMEGVKTIDYSSGNISDSMSSKLKYRILKESSIDSETNDINYYYLREAYLAQIDSLDEQIEIWGSKNISTIDEELKAIELEQGILKKQIVEIEDAINKAKELIKTANIGEQDIVEKIINELKKIQDVTGTVVMKGRQAVATAKRTHKTTVELKQTVTLDYLEARKEKLQDDILEAYNRLIQILRYLDKYKINSTNSVTKLKEILPINYFDINTKEDKDKELDSINTRIGANRKLLEAGVTDEALKDYHKELQNDLKQYIIKQYNKFIEIYNVTIKDDTIKKYDNVEDIQKEIKNKYNSILKAFKKDQTNESLQELLDFIDDKNKFMKQIVNYLNGNKYVPDDTLKQLYAQTLELEIKKLEAEATIIRDKDISSTKDEKIKKDVVDILFNDYLTIAYKKTNIEALQKNETLFSVFNDTVIANMAEMPIEEFSAYAKATVSDEELKAVQEHIPEVKVQYDDAMKYAAQRVVMLNPDVVYADDVVLTDGSTIKKFGMYDEYNDVFNMFYYNVNEPDKVTFKTIYAFRVLDKPLLEPTNVQIMFKVDSDKDAMKQFKYHHNKNKRLSKINQGLIQHYNGADQSMVSIKKLISFYNVYIRKQGRVKNEIAYANKLDISHLKFDTMANVMKRKFNEYMFALDHASKTSKIKSITKDVYAGIYYKLYAKTKAYEPGKIINLIHPDFAFQYITKYDEDAVYKNKLRLIRLSENSTGYSLMAESPYDLDIMFKENTNPMRSALSHEKLYDTYTPIGVVNDYLELFEEHKQDEQKALKAFYDKYEQYTPVKKGEIYMNPFTPNVMSDVYERNLGLNVAHQLGINTSVGFFNDPMANQDTIDIDEDFAISHGFENGNKIWLEQEGFKGAINYVKGLYKMYGVNIIANAKSLVDRGSGGLPIKLALNNIQKYLNGDSENFDKDILDVMKTYEDEIKKYFKLTNNKLIVYSGTDYKKILNDITNGDYTKFIVGNTTIENAAEHKDSFKYYSHKKGVIYNYYNDLKDKKIYKGFLYVKLDSEHTASHMQILNKVKSYKDLNVIIRDFKNDVKSGVIISPTVAYTLESKGVDWLKAFPPETDKVELYESIMYDGVNAILSKYDLTGYTNNKGVFDIEKLLLVIKNDYHNPTIIRFVEEYLVFYKTALAYKQKDAAESEAAKYKMETVNSKLIDYVNKALVGKKGIIYRSVYRKHPGIRGQYLANVSLGLGEMKISIDGMLTLLKSKPGFLQSKTNTKIDTDGIIKKLESMIAKRDAAIKNEPSSVKKLQIRREHNTDIAKYYDKLNVYSYIIAVRSPVQDHNATPVIKIVGLTTHSAIEVNAYIYNVMGADNDGDTQGLVALDAEQYKILKNLDATKEDYYDREYKIDDKVVPGYLNDVESKELDTKIFNKLPVIKDLSARYMYLGKRVLKGTRYNELNEEDKFYTWGELYYGAFGNDFKNYLNTIKPINTKDIKEHERKTQEQVMERYGQIHSETLLKKGGDELGKRVAFERKVLNNEIKYSNFINIQESDFKKYYKDLSLVDRELVNGIKDIPEFIKSLQNNEIKDQKQLDLIEHIIQNKFYYRILYTVMNRIQTSKNGVNIFGSNLKKQLVSSELSTFVHMNNDPTGRVWLKLLKDKDAQPTIENIGEGIFGNNIKLKDVINQITDGFTEPYKKEQDEKIIYSKVEDLLKAMPIRDEVKKLLDKKDPAYDANIAADFNDIVKRVLLNYFYSNEAKKELGDLTTIMARNNLKDLIDFLDTAPSLQDQHIAKMLVRKYKNLIDKNKNQLLTIEDDFDKVDSKFLYIIYFGIHSSEGRRVIQKHDYSKIEDNIVKQNIVDRSLRTKNSRLLQEIISLSKHEAVDRDYTEFYEDFVKRVKKLTSANSIRKVTMGYKERLLSTAIAMDTNPFEMEDLSYSRPSTQEVKELFKYKAPVFNPTESFSIRDFDNIMRDNLAVELCGQGFLTATRYYENIETIVLALMELAKQSTTILNFAENAEDKKITLYIDGADTVTTIGEALSYYKIPAYRLERALISLVTNSQFMLTTLKRKGNNLDINKTKFIPNIFELLKYLYIKYDPQNVEALKNNDTPNMSNFFLNVIDDAILLLDDTDDEINDISKNGILYDAAMINKIVNTLSMNLKNHGVNIADYEEKINEDENKQYYTALVQRMFRDLNLDVAQNINTLEDSLKSIIGTFTTDEILKKELTEEINESNKKRISLESKLITIYNNVVYNYQDITEFTKAITELQYSYNDLKRDIKKLEDSVHRHQLKLSTTISKKERMLNDRETYYNKLKKEDIKNALIKKRADVEDKLKKLEEQILNAAFAESFNSEVRNLITKTPRARDTYNENDADDLRSKLIQNMTLRTTSFLDYITAYAIKDINNNIIDYDWDALFKHYKENHRLYRLIIIRNVDEDETGSKKLIDLFSKKDNNLYNGKKYDELSKREKRKYRKEHYKEIKFKTYEELFEAKEIISSTGKTYKGINISLKEKNFIMPSVKEIDIKSGKDLQDVYNYIRANEQDGTQALIGIMDLNSIMDFMDIVYKPSFAKNGYENFIIKLQSLQKLMMRFSAGFLLRNYMDSWFQLMSHMYTEQGSNGIINGLFTDKKVLSGYLLMAGDVYGVYKALSTERLTLLADTDLKYQEIVKLLDPKRNALTEDNLIRVQEYANTIYNRMKLYVESLGNIKDANERTKERVDQGNEILKETKNLIEYLNAKPNNMTAEEYRKNILQLNLIKAKPCLESAIVFLGSMKFSEFYDVIENTKIKDNRNTKYISKLKKKYSTSYFDFKQVLFEVNAFMKTNAQIDQYKSDEYKTLHNIVEQQKIKDLESETLTYDIVTKRIKEESKGTYADFKKFSVYNIYGTVNETIENTARIAGYLLDRYINNYTYNETVNLSLKRFFNYGQRNPLEKQLLADIPYLSFPIRTIDNWINRLTDRRFITLMSDIVDGVYGQYEDEDGQYDEFTKNMIAQGWLPVVNGFGLRLGNGLFDVQNILSNGSEFFTQRRSPLLRAVDILIKTGNLKESLKALATVGLTKRIATAIPKVREAPAVRELTGGKPWTIGSSSSMTFNWNDYSKYVPYKYRNNGRYKWYENVYKDWFNKYGRMRRPTVNPLSIVKNTQWRTYIRYRRTQQMLR